MLDYFRSPSSATKLQLWRPAVEVIPFLSMHAVPGLDSGAPNQDFALYVYNGS